MSRKVKEVNGFKVGDTITGCGSNNYYITNGGGLYEVIELLDDDYDDIKVRVISHQIQPEEAGGIWEVNSRLFKLVERPKKKSDNINQIKHIITGNKTIVVVQQPDGIYKKGETRSHPEDEFNEYEGLRIALARAYGIDPFEEEKTNKDINIDKFLHSKFTRDNKIAVHCKTIKEAEQFAESCKKNGVTWCSGKSMVGSLLYEDYKEETCYTAYDDSGVTFSPINYFKSKGYEIIEFEDLIKTQLAKTLKYYTNKELLEELKSRLL